MRQRGFRVVGLQRDQAKVEMRMRQIRVYLQHLVEKRLGQFVLVPVDRGVHTQKKTFDFGKICRFYRFLLLHRFLPVGQFLKVSRFRPDAQARP